MSMIHDVLALRPVLRVAHELVESVEKNSPEAGHVDICRRSL